MLFIFLLPEQKKNETKRKFAVCIFLPTPVLLSAKEKELATLKQRYSLLFFCLDAKEKVTKEKIKAALFWLLQSGVPLKKKNSLRSNSFFFLTFHPSPSASRQKSEANTHRNIASLVRVNTHLNERSNVESPLGTGL